MKKLVFLTVALLLIACNRPDKKVNIMQDKLKQYAIVKLDTDLSGLSAEEKKMLGYLFQVADIMDELFWKQAYGNKHELLDTCTDESIKDFILVNYGPWERLGDDNPFLANIQAKPLGANFYPPDMTEAEFIALNDSLKKGPYTVIRRDERGFLEVIPYHIEYQDELKKATDLVKKAAALSNDSAFKKYLKLRAEALLTDDYQPSDMAWMDMRDNTIDFIFGPIENYEDKLFGYKTAFEAFILLKDKAWSEKLNRFSALLPELQNRLPVDPRYKAESPGSSSDLAAYDVLYYAGDCNAGSKTIAINLPNDEYVQMIKGSRRLQLKNAMQAKFDKILVPIASELMDSSQQQYITFDAFFENVMFHEVAHGLGIKNILTGKGTVRTALKEQYSALEEGKADILGLYLVYQLSEMGEIKTDLRNNYTTFLAGIFRSIRFGTSSAHGVANLVRFNYFREKEAFVRDDDGKYSVNYEKIQEAANSLSREILTIQGNGDYEAAKRMVEKYGSMPNDLKDDLARINTRGIPVDIIFDQGPDVLDLE